MKLIALAAAAAVVFAATPAVSQETARPLAALVACRALTDPVARLACMDREVDALVTANTRRDVVVLDRADVKATRRSLFGFALPKIKLFGGRDEVADDTDVLATTITGVRSLGYGKWSFTTSEGAVWQTTEATRDVPVNGRAVTIDRGALGAYFVSFSRGRSTRAMRIK